MRSVSEALVWFAKASHDPNALYLNRCLQAARTAYGLPALYLEADIAWAHTKFRSEPQAKPPAGWLIWWDRPGHPTSDHDAGHVAVSAGDGMCWCNDVKRRARLDLVRISDISKAWSIPRVGDSRDLNGQLVVPTDNRVPPITHPHVITVSSGDTLSELVAHWSRVKGITWRDVWLDPHNSGLRARRGRPEAIRPGDHVWIP